MSRHFVIPPLWLSSNVFHYIDISIEEFNVIERRKKLRTNIVRLCESTLRLHSLRRRPPSQPNHCPFFLWALCPLRRAYERMFCVHQHWCQRPKFAKCLLIPLLQQWEDRPERRSPRKLSPGQKSANNIIKDVKSRYLRFQGPLRSRERHPSCRPSSHH